MKQQTKQSAKKRIDILKKGYFDPKLPTAFGGKTKLIKSLKRPKSKVKPSQISKWLDTTDTYTLHKPVKRKFKRRQYVVARIDSTWQCDLVDLQKLAKYNRGNKYILFAIDVFS